MNLIEVKYKLTKTKLETNWKLIRSELWINYSYGWTSIWINSICYVKMMYVTIDKNMAHVKIKFIIHNFISEKKDILKIYTKFWKNLFHLTW
jgi:hypothetical protein